MMDSESRLKSYLSRRRRATSIFVIGLVGDLIDRRADKMIHARVLKFNQYEVEDLLLACKKAKSHVSNEVGKLLEDGDRHLTIAEELSELGQLEIDTIHDCKVFAARLKKIGEVLNRHTGFLYTVIIPRSPYFNFGEIGLMMAVAAIVVTVVRL